MKPSRFAAFDDIERDRVTNHSLNLRMYNQHKKDNHPDAQISKDKNYCKIATE